MKLIEFLKKEKIAQAEFARRLGIHKSHMYQITGGWRRPGVELAREIVKMSKGRITLDELLPPKEKKRAPKDDL